MSNQERLKGNHLPKEYSVSYEVQRANLPIKNSWILTLPSAQAYSIPMVSLCKCGKNSFFRGSIIKSVEPKYVCTHCGNDVFIDVGEFLNSREESYWFDFSWECESSIEKEDTVCRYETSAFFYIPFFDAMDNYISFRKIKLSSLLLFLYEDTPTSYISESAHHKNIKRYKLYQEGSFRYMEDIVRDMLYEKLDALIESYPVKSLEFLYEDDLIYRVDARKRVEICNFFLQNPRLKDIRLFFWEKEALKHMLNDYTNKDFTCKEMLDLVANQKSKAIKKHLYTQHEELNLLEEQGVYDPSADLLFADLFTDTSYTLSLIKLPYEKKLSFISSRNISSVTSFINFLKKRFSEVQIKNLFLEMMSAPTFDQFMDDVTLFEDTVRMFDRRGVEEFLEDNYIDHKLNLKELHEAMIIVTIQFKGEGDNLSIEYSEEEKNLAGVWGDIVFRLPLDTNELLKWGYLLHNCLGGYGGRVYKKESLIIGCYKNETLRYAIHLKPIKNQILEAKAKYNKNIPVEDLKIIKEWIEIQT